MINRIKPFTLLVLIAALLASCSGGDSTPAIEQTNSTELTTPATSAKTQMAVPTAAFTDTPLPISENIVYYYFADIQQKYLPDGSIVISPDTYILAPTSSDTTFGTDPAAELRTALESALRDNRNGWISTNVEIVDVTFSDGHVNVILLGEYFGVGDVTLIAAKMQILMTVFANPSVQTATVTLNGDTISNLGISNSVEAKPADYAYTRAEIETFMNENAYTSP